MAGATVLYTNHGGLVYLCSTYYSGNTSNARVCKYNISYTDFLELQNASAIGGNYSEHLRVLQQPGPIGSFQMYSTGMNFGKQTNMLHMIDIKAVVSKRGRVS